MVGCSSQWLAAVAEGWLQCPAVVCSDVWLCGCPVVGCRDVYVVAITSNNNNNAILYTDGLYHTRWFSIGHCENITR